MLKLREAKRSKEYALAGVRVTVGRAASNDIVLDDPSVSGFHAVLLQEAGEVTVTDLGSTNGTRVSGAPVEGRTTLPLWCTLEVGDVCLELVDPEQRAPTRVMKAIPSGTGTVVKPAVQGAAAEQSAPSSAGELVRRTPGPYPEVVAVPGEITVGRAAGADLQLAVETVSSRHARIVPSADGCELIDENSSNGTWVNEQRIERHRLRHGDRIRFDLIEYEWREPGAPAVAATRLQPAISDTAAPTRVQPAVGNAPAPTQISAATHNISTSPPHQQPSHPPHHPSQHQPPHQSFGESFHEPPFGRSTSGGKTAATHPQLSATAVMEGLSYSGVAERPGPLFSRMLAHYRDFLPGLLLLLASSVMGWIYLAIALSAPHPYTYHAAASSALGIPPGREWETVLLWGGGWALQLGGWFALLRGAGAVQGVCARTAPELLPRLLAYIGAWLAVTLLLALTAVGVATVAAALGASASVVTLVATALAVLWLYLTLRLWPLFVQLPLVQQAAPVATAWQMTAQPGALTQASWPIVGWFTLGYLLLVGAGSPLALEIGWPSWFFAVLLGGVWVALVAPWLALLAVSRWQRLAALRR
ncbi:hypothetical protein CKO15_05645 [Halorhodospira abdelmalekii]|uniref:FHA domain-containing protein n=1 Tax=Halorhodospira abdelmalekii TaxID=421629 RepID=UPI0019079A24|nr:FHA domain-containing protein [Halorhodospira abdelmalekii]MBK1734780.1 hypothetical protein [Halorhodospira abdelmalekii]